MGDTTDAANWRSWKQRALTAEHELAKINVVAQSLTSDVLNQTAKLKSALSASDVEPKTTLSHVLGEVSMATPAPTGNPTIDALISAIAAEDAEIAQILAYVATIPAQITTAVNAALAGGATAAQLEALTQLATDVQSQTAAMSAAIPSSATTPPAS